LSLNVVRQTVGEFARGLRELLHGGYFKPPSNTTRPADIRPNKLSSAEPIA
jgi:hypothetical protein